MYIIDYYKKYPYICFRYRMVVGEWILTERLDNCKDTANRIDVGT